jgi:hypothetical protein
MLVHQSISQRKACSVCVKSEAEVRFEASRVFQMHDTKAGLPIYTYLMLVNQEYDANPSQDAFANNLPSSNMVCGPPTIKLVDMNVTFLLQFADNSDSIQPGWIEAYSSPYDSFPFPEIGTIREDQLEYCISQFQDCIATLVQQSRNDFIHFPSYQETLPTSMSRPPSVCALYCQKVTQNKAIIFKMLDLKVSSLLAQAKTSFCSMEGRLLQVKGLLLYHFIRLFDGGIRQRPTAERDFEHLEAWTIKLHQTYAASGNDLIWDSLHHQWVHFESVRRTTMMSAVLQSAYSAI